MHKIDKINITHKRTSLDLGSSRWIGVLILVNLNPSNSLIDKKHHLKNFSRIFFAANTSTIFCSTLRFGSILIKMLI